jgi:hypothetical protein
VYQPILVILGNVIIYIEVCQAIPALVDGDALNKINNFQCISRYW